MRKHSKAVKVWIGAKRLKSNLKLFTFEVKYPVQRFLKEIEGFFNIKKNLYQ